MFVVVFAVVAVVVTPLIFPTELGTIGSQLLKAGPVTSCSRSGPRSNVQCRLATAVKPGRMKIRISGFFLFFSLAPLGNFAHLSDPCPNLRPPNFQGWECCRRHSFVHTALHPAFSGLHTAFAHGIVDFCTRKFSAWSR